MHDDGNPTWDNLTAQADVYLRTADAARLATVAEPLIEAEPEAPFGYRMAAEAAGMRGDLKGAVRWGRRALEQDPDDGFTMYRLAVFLRVDGKLPEAQELVEWAIELDPEYAWYWHELAQICLDEDDHEGARRYAQRALELDPELTEARRVLAATRPGRKGAAFRLATLDAALRTDPEDADLWGDRARALLDLRRVEEAESAARTALAVAPGSRAHRRTLFRALKQRDLVYRVLRLPGDVALAGFRWIDRMNWGLWILLCLVGIGKFIFVPLVFVLLSWVLFVWPMLKLYEWTTLREAHARAGALAPSPGPLGVHRWPRALRLALFVAVMAAFWYGVARALGTGTGQAVLVWGVVVVLGGGLVLVVIGSWLTIRDKLRARRRRRRMARLEGEGLG